MTSLLRFNMDHLAIVVASITVLSLVGVLGSAIFAPVARAALTDTADFSQVINDGTVAVEIRSDDTTPVGSPSYSLTAVNFSFACQQATGTNVLGDASQYIYVDDPSVSGASSGWDLTIAATGGVGDLWENAGVTQTYDYNDSTGSGCTDGADAPDTDGGQLTIDPTAGAFVARCASCDLTGITEGTSDSFVSGSVDSIDIGASDGTDTVGRWRYTGGTLTQWIPAEQPADTYTIGMTITVAEN